MIRPFVVEPAPYVPVRAVFGRPDAFAVTVGDIGRGFVGLEVHFAGRTFGDLEQPNGIGVVALGMQRFLDQAALRCRPDLAHLEPIPAFFHVVEAEAGGAGSPIPRFGGYMGPSLDGATLLVLSLEGRQLVVGSDRTDPILSCHWLPEGTVEHVIGLVLRYLAVSSRLDLSGYAGWPVANALSDTAESVWIFHGGGSRFAGAVFSELARAKQWVSLHALSGVLTWYPVGQSVYDWAVEKGVYKPKVFGSDATPRMQRFSSGSQPHFHFEDGVEVG